MSLYEVSVKSNKGKIRDYNQDNFAVNDVCKPIDNDDFDDYYTVSEDRIVIAVFDGVGGLKSGEIASGLAAKNFAEEYHKNPMFSCEDYLYATNRIICDQSTLNNIVMGTTAVICEIKNDKVRSINIGDSRAYLFDGENILQISKDHAEIVGFAKSYDISGNERKHTMLTQYLGISEEEFIIEPYVSDWFDMHNNHILLCSDGLVSHLSDSDIESVLRRHISIHDKTNYLLKIALDEGGSDNITLILMGGRDE